MLFPTQPAVAVYFNPRNEVFIRQESHFDPEEDHNVFIQRKNIGLLIARLREIENEVG